MDISGLDKAVVLAALYNASKQQGMGFIHSRGQEPMSVEQSQLELIKAVDDEGKVYFDYLHGRVMKINLTSDEVNTWAYNRDNGVDAAERVIEALRETQI